MALCLDGSIESKNISLISNSAEHPLDCGYTGIFCREDRYSELGQVPAIVLSTAIDRFLPIATGSLGSVKNHLILELDVRLSRDRSWPISAFGKWPEVACRGCWINVRLEQTSQRPLSTVIGHLFPKSVCRNWSDRVFTCD
jgi:hypothetical protein